MHFVAGAFCIKVVSLSRLSFLFISCLFFSFHFFTHHEQLAKYYFREYIDTQQT